ncbi:MAG: UDP-3-O-[3-hydroxymyristoyl] N-acetylglucosamine deacetylase (EC [uncultured Thiotrichaceae bacterium]|uniref:UDP-3-O-acyl-N-acetylglucosamine deacetylase n=1 Tax=uncultured Thiotrichaceae bacterium TaxID=298394 RepID=A0A6S6S9K3_9GAMM|nr:MAG: UDP-3-O-[3-hydroxymyristoyl] N-acetylglucosamine deacetylase (EC [uncultured Thiotrichaceae bacterium]
MNEHSQQTICQELSFSGPGLHTAGHHIIILKPAVENTGIIFRRKDATGEWQCIPAHWKYTKVLPLCTCIAVDDALHVRTIEHLMAALYACGIDNLEIDIEGSEVPILDGSALPFIEAINKVGVQTQSSARTVYTVIQEHCVEEGSRYIKIEPAGMLELDLTIVLAKIGKQRWQGVVTPASFTQECSQARTFGRLKSGLLAQLTRFQKDSICLGANQKSAVVIVGNKAINKGGLRMPDEYIRHRVLDLVGDLMLAGGHLQGKITAVSPAHRLNHQLLTELFKNHEIDRSPR